MQTIVGKNPDMALKKIKKSKWCLTALVLFVILINVICTLLRNDENHYLMLAVNIVTDISLGVFLTAYLNLVLIPRVKAKKIYGGNKAHYRGVIESVSETTVRVGGLDCFKVTLLIPGRRFFFLCDNGEISIEEGREVSVYAVSGVIAEVEYED